MSEQRHADSCGFALYGPPAICTCAPDVSDREIELIAAILRVFKKFPDLDRIQKIEALGRTFSALIQIEENHPATAGLWEAL